MKPIVKLRLTKSSISSTHHTAVIYGPQYLGGIGLFDPFMIQGADRISFLIKQLWKHNPSSPLINANLLTIQLEVGRGKSILEKNYHKTQLWLQIESWICEV